MTLDAPAETTDDLEILDTDTDDLEILDDLEVLDDNEDLDTDTDDLEILDDVDNEDLEVLDTDTDDLEILDDVDNDETEAVTATDGPGDDAKTPDRRSGKSPYLIAGLVLLAAAVAAGAVALFANKDNESTTTTATTATTAPSPAPASVAAVAPSTTIDPNTTSVFMLTTGVCLDAPELGSGPVSQLIAADCDTPHSHEVYAVLSYPSEDGVFDAEAVSEFARQSCSDSLLAYAPAELIPSLQFISLEPTAQGWDAEDDREVVCLLLDPENPLTSSAAAG